MSAATPPPPPPLVLDGRALEPSEVEQVARAGREVGVAAAAAAAMDASRAVIDASLRDGAAHYGINTGFGSLARRRIGPDDVRSLQVNLVRSHSAGVGAPLPRDATRAMMLTLAASLCRGRSGTRPEVARRLVEMLNAGLTPVVPSTGSVGASGDLAPLAHVALVLIGEGRAWLAGREWAGGEALAAAGLAPLTLEAKEGLALVNGTHLMAGWAALLCVDFERLVDAALAAAAMSIDACRGTDAFLDERVYAARRQPGPAAVAARLRSLLRGSEVIPSHVAGDPRVQDPYSLRCAATVLGAALDLYGYVAAAVRAELGAVTDNPLVFTEPGRPPIVSAGNFHGMPVALPLDALAIAVAHVAGVSERRTYLMLSASDPESRLVPHLSPQPGLHSGLMVTQYTAAACVNEITGLACPATPANIPTCAGVEDYNSFGPRAAAKAARAIELARAVVAVELICAAQGLELHRPLRSGHGVEAALELVRSRVPRYGADRPPGPDIEAVAELTARGAFTPL